MVGLAVALVSALVVGGARSASQPQGLIAFTREDGVYVMRPDGSDVRLLWRGSTGPTDLAWSPDGRMLVFGTGGGRVRVMNADGSGVVRIASVVARSLSWSPDGRRIAFTRWHDAETPDVWVMNADGSKMRRLKRTPLWEGNVDWKPTGGWLAFDSGSWVPFVYVMRTDGSGLRQLPPERGLRGWPDSTDPDWSPDGRRIVFASVAGSGVDFEVWVMNASGKQWVRLTTNRVHDRSPAWSPEGRRIAFMRIDRKSGGIYVMNADGTGLRRLTHNSGDRSPAWQPVVVPSA